MKIRDKFCDFIALYHKVILKDEFETFAKNSEINLDSLLSSDPFQTVVPDDFNVKSNF